jgi:hypothetical protein
MKANRAGATGPGDGGSLVGVRLGSRENGGARRVASAVVCARRAPYPAGDPRTHPIGVHVSAGALGASAVRSRWLPDRLPVWEHGCPATGVRLPLAGRPLVRSGSARLGAVRVRRVELPVPNAFEGVRVVAVNRVPLAHGALACACHDGLTVPRCHDVSGVCRHKHAPCPVCTRGTGKAHA